MYPKYTGFKGFEGSKERHNQINKIIDPYQMIRECDRSYPKGWEIFTPVWVAKQMLAQIPIQEWSNPTLRVLDPCCKSGIFLLEAYHLLMKGLEARFPDPVKRRTHIIFNQLYGVTTCKTGATLARKVIFGDPTIRGHIGYMNNWSEIVKNSPVSDYTKLVLQATSNNTKDWKEDHEMKFDIIIGNPPYQDETGGGAYKSAMPMYQHFVCQAIWLKPRYISMIIPSRWMAGGKSILDKFRADMVECKHIGSIYNFEKSKEIFDGVAIAGGVQYFLYESQRTFETVNIVNCRLNEATGVLSLNSVQRDLGRHLYRGRDNTKEKQYLIIADNKAEGIVEKVGKASNVLMGSVVLQRQPFGFDSNVEGDSVYSESNPIQIVCSGSRFVYTDMESITQNRGIVDKWKVCTGKINADAGGTSGSATNNVINKPRILGPRVICSSSYLVLDTFDTKEEAINCMYYISTKFARYLIWAALSGLNMTSRNYMFVPVQDYTHPWTDEQLYQRYNLSEDEIDTIESTIKSWVN